ncbi:MAG: hypothetical protein QOH21_1025 [Acidobacteriota bacterium]|nr:hypothetical protein [Acidobacteriota bacterium]
MFKGMRFEAELAGNEAVPAGVIRERVYGAVRVVAEWPADLTTPELRIAVEVLGDVDRRNAPAYVELFFHDVFLLLNLASPGSFGGTLSITGGELRVRELTFHPHVFASAAGLPQLPLPSVIAWYDALQTGTQQVATSDEAKALFQLLRLGRAEEDEEQSIVRLATAVEALRVAPEPRLLALRDELLHGRIPIFHPMHDDGLDARVEDATRQWIGIADAAATLVIRTLQERVVR